MAEQVKVQRQVFADTDFRVHLTQGRVSSIKYGKDKKAVEFISPSYPFGDINLLITKGEASYRLSTRGLIPESLEGGELNRSLAHFSFPDLPSFSVRMGFVLEGHVLRYQLTLHNGTDAPCTLRDLALPFAVNNAFAWGVDATQRVLRHSMVAGDNTFLYWTPCDGKPPYLLCLPQPGTRGELYDIQADVDEESSRGRGNYQLYLHASAEEAVAREKGCNWRQPVSACEIAPGESRAYGFDFLWAEGYQGVKDALSRHGMLDVTLAPGMTIPRGHVLRLAIRSMHQDLEVTAEYPEATSIQKLHRKADVDLYELQFSHLGENKLVLRYGDGRESLLEFFVTLPLRELIHLRAAFIAGHQHRDPTKWYNGLLAEWNNETGALLGPDNYDRIKGWRIYEVTCDDPGLSKPAFLASKNAEYPDAAEVEALEYYVAHFVWGGLQRSQGEECSYGIYGIPDWHTLRNSQDLGPRGQMHIWRIYDYPHLALVYLRLYQIGKRRPEMLTHLSATDYLHRAYRTFLALYQYPQEIDDWSAYKTGLYNELVITEVIEALRAENQPLQAQRLYFHWQRKAKFFVTACEDLFGSEYPFDTTGTESTHALATWALRHAAHAYEENPRNKPDYTLDQATMFYDYQLDCNLACRGVQEHAYYLLGSDYRNCSAHYSLSYMSQMGGWSILDDALYRREQPAERLRLGYASILSSWALMNAGDRESNFGYWFPGEMHNGAAGGGFENAPYGETWLDQPHHRGSWYYSCEIDLGFCGGLRAAATVLAEDPLLGTVVYGGRLEGRRVLLEDGLQRRFHHIKAQQRVHLVLQNARIHSIVLEDEGTYRVCLEMVDLGACCRLSTWAPAGISIQGLENAPDAQGWVSYPIPEGTQQLLIRLHP